jgi:elongation factor Ts
VTHLKKNQTNICIYPIFLASRSVNEGVVGVARDGSKAAMVILNCESEPVSKTPDFNRLVQSIAETLVKQQANEYDSDQIFGLEGVKDQIAQTIGLLKENIKIKKGLVLEENNIGIYVRNQNKDFPLNGTYGAIVG